ncbi:phage tail protein [Escherichia coli]|uniref:phage tail protein n=1 Tax=Escherichia coli TaxID=562 RepID=UPI0005B45397|nr:phage tail protein [Escherichia coli]EFA7775937.1 phage tail protein [Escherichia coli O157:H7]HCV5302063.1 phage tail protein [Shigella sonnei]EET1392808.1 phage tail protein [Escherichia coli]EEU1835034.1 phage tail protein [Escherichia coli]EEY6692027.1 phage tail protein [Escherichia coli]
MSTKFKTVITTAGAAKLAAATAPGGRKVNITTMAVGDGGGKLPVPDAGQTGLIHEVWRHALNKISQDKRNSNYIIAELVIPPEVGGFWMRELGLYDDAGTLIAVANMAESYKPALAEGSGRSQTCRMVIIVSSVASVELTIDTTTVMATQDYVDDKIAEHEQSRRHPDASLTAKGFTQLSSATNSTSEMLAATPKAVKTVMDETNKKAPLNSPALTGTPTTPTARQGTNNTQIANTAFVMAAIAALVDSSPDALNTLNELAAALGNDPNFATTMTNALAGKQPKDATLTALAGLATAADRFPYFTGNDVASLATLTKVGRDILAKSTVAAVIEYLGLQETVNQASGALQKNQNGADIPDKDRFLSNINVYSKGEVDKKKGMRQYVFNAPSNAVGGKWYPVIFRRSTGSTGELASRVVITTTSAGGDYAMNNCEFNGMVMPGGWTDRGSYAAGYFSTYQTNERAIHSIVTSLKEDDVCSVFYVEGRAFPVRVFAEEGLTVIVPTQDYTVGQTTYKWGATNPATESTNAQAILDFNNGRGFYCSHSIFGINAIFSGNLGIGTANALGGNSIVLGDNDTGFKQNGDGVLDAYANGVHVFRFRNGSAISLKGIQAGESKLFTLSSANTAAHNASFNLWGNSSRPTVAELGDDSGWHFYSQRNTDNSVTFAVNGQIQPSSWGNIDSRYVKDVRLGSQQYYGVNNWQTWNFQCPSGHVLSGINVQDTGSNSADNIAGVYYRPVQKYINGTWYNVASV